MAKNLPAGPKNTGTWGVNTTKDGTPDTSVQIIFPVNF